MIWKYFSYFLVGFIGFAIGRVGHILGGQVAWIPHHWIFGLILLSAGLVCLLFKRGRNIGYYLIFFGAGVFISDFRDFTLGRVWELDDVTILKFWGVD
ncbi:MAG: hypothetical protein WC845_02485 [Candidatus Staskawiczbacteria bacterium]|jgi:hypothetical protein